MNRSIHCLIMVGGLACIAAGCATSYQGVDGNRGTTTIRIVGDEGSSVTGYYVQDGYRVAISEPLPLSLSHAGLSEIEIHKDHPDATFALAAQYDDAARHSEVVSQVDRSVTGLRLRVYDGMVVEKLK